MIQWLVLVHFAFNILVALHPKRLKNELRSELTIERISENLILI